jgi:hypothetical protein
MSSLPATSVRRHFGTLFRVGTVAGLSDEQLLKRVAKPRNESAEAAFEALVRRHGPMVLGVCRRLLRDEHDASDESTVDLEGRIAKLLESPAKDIRQN